MRRWSAAGIAVTVLFLLSVAWLAHLQNGGPAHQPIELSNGVTGMMYLPGPIEPARANPFYELFAKPQALRPPAVVLMHGFMSDSVMMSTLARRLAENGYAVLAIDANGHGANRNPFGDTMTRSGALRDDFSAAVDFLRNYERVDGSRIVVMGHSMGAGATLDFATHEPGLSGAVMISGGWTLGPIRPRNALFIFAEHDPAEEIQGPSTAIAEHLAGVSPIEAGKQYGDFAQGSAVEVVQMPGENHISIVTSRAVAMRIVRWVDGVFGTTRTSPINLHDARTRARNLAAVLFIFVLIVIGRVTGSIAPLWNERPAGAAGWIGVLTIAVALLAAMPLISTILPAGFFPMVVGDAQVSWLIAASVLAIGYLAIFGRLEGPSLRGRIGRTVLAATLAFAAIYLGSNAIAVTMHRLSLTPERLLMLVLGTILTLPFWYAFEVLVRRGGVVISTVLGTTGRIVFIALMGVGVALRILPGVLMLAMPILVPIFLVFEIFAASAYSTSRNLALIATVEALWFVWLIAATNPITFML
ncbi:MAG TPA: alpha/beta fold hydrolase [Candidatus Binataceae bacterium]|nr:alpha/beta fold hydrolase [Candidatus Binataceae bacterium]